MLWLRRRMVSFKFSHSLVHLNWRNHLEECVLWHSVGSDPSYQPGRPQAGTLLRRGDSLNSDQVHFCWNCILQLLLASLRQVSKWNEQLEVNVAQWRQNVWLPKQWDLERQVPQKDINATAIVSAIGICHAGTKNMRKLFGTSGKPSLWWHIIPSPHSHLHDTGWWPHRSVEPLHAIIPKCVSRDQCTYSTLALAFVCHKLNADCRLGATPAWNGHLLEQPFWLPV